MISLFYDETATEKQDLVGYGCLSADEKTADIVINEALQNLKNDPDFDDKDKTTLARGYFHACDDSKNAHSHLCNSIRKNLKGNFTSFFYKTKNKTDLELLFKYTQDSIGVSTLFATREEINVSFECRNNKTEQAFRKWYENLINKLFPNLFENPKIELCFPKTNFFVHKKQNSIGQICDFLLWAALKYSDNRNDVWWNRLGGTYRTEPMEYSPDKNITFISCDVEYNAYYLLPVNKYNNVIITKKNNTIPELAKTYIEGENFIENLSIIPKTIDHFSNEILNFNKNKKKDKNRIVKCAKLFLKIIDTGDFFKNKEYTEIEDLLFIKKTMAYLTIPDDIYVNDRINALEQYILLNNL